MSKFCVTLSDLRKHWACYEGYNRVVRSLQGKPFSVDDEERESYIRFRYDQPISLICIAESNGLYDALWATRCLVGEDRNLRLYAVWCVRQVQHLMADPRSIAALNVSEAFANERASLDQLSAAEDAAEDAARDAAWAEVRDAALDTAWAVARAAASAAVGDAAWDAAWAAAWAAASAAASAAVGDASDVVGESVEAAQKEMFIKMCKGQAPWQQTTEGASLHSKDFETMKTKEK